MKLILSFIDRFLLDSMPYIAFGDAFKLARTSGFSTPSEPQFVEALKQLDKDKIIHFIGDDKCFFIVTEEYMLNVFTNNGKEPLSELGTISIQAVCEAKNKYLRYRT